MYKTKKEIDHLKVLIENKIKHTYLDKYIQKPKIDETKLVLLHAILDNVNLNTHTKERYIITTMLVQIALDAHDFVSDRKEKEEDPSEVVSKQLTVLAGDYYSGLYYFLLSDINDFQLINTLASAIKKINELKMGLYYNEFSTYEEFIDLVKQIESLLIVHVAEYVEQTTLIPFTEEWLLTSKLMNEQLTLNSIGFSSLIDNWLHDLSFFSNDTSYFEKCIWEKMKYIETMLSKLPDNYASMATYIANNLNAYKSKLISAVEEG